MWTRSSRFSLIALLLAATVAVQPRLARSEVACRPTEPCAELAEPTGEMACCATHEEAPPPLAPATDDSGLPDCCYLKHAPAAPLTSVPAVVSVPPPDAAFLVFPPLPVSAEPRLIAVPTPVDERDPPWRLDVQRVHAPRGPPASL